MKLKDLLDQASKYGQIKSLRYTYKNKRSTLKCQYADGQIRQFTQK